MNQSSPDLPTHWFMIRLSSLGDVALSTGVLAYWQRVHGWTFTVVTKEAFAPIFREHPAVTEIIALKNDELSFARLVPLFRTMARRANGAGLVDLHGTPRSRLLSLFWRGPVRRYNKLTLQRRFFLQSGGRFFQSALNACNVPQRYAKAVETIPPPRTELLPLIVLSESEKQDAARRLAGFPRQGRPLVALHPYAAHPDKAWTREAWQELIAALDADAMDWFVIGKVGSAETEERLPGIPPERDFTNATSLRETCALLRVADALVTGDSGPMHLAAGVGTPVAALFGPTTSEWGFAPAGPRDEIIETERDCRPCSLHGKSLCPHGRACMRDITPHMVMQGLARCLRKRATPSPAGE